MTSRYAYVLDEPDSRLGSSVRFDSWRDNVPSHSFEPTNSGLSDREVGLASKLAGRRNAAAIPQSQVDELYSERKTLLDKKFFGNDFSPADRRKLALIRWKIDCVIDARHGAHLDRLEEAMKSYQRVAEDIKSLKEELTRSTMNNQEARKDAQAKRVW